MKRVIQMHFRRIARLALVSSQAGLHRRCIMWQSAGCPQCPLHI